MERVVRRPWKLMVRDFEGGTGAFMGMVSALGAGAWAMRAAGARARRRAVGAKSFMGIRVYREGGWWWGLSGG